MEPLDDDECAEDYGYRSDSDLEEDEDSASSKETPKKMEPVRGHLFDPFCFSFVDKKAGPIYGEHKECLEEGKVIKIQDIAFIT